MTDINRPFHHQPNQPNVHQAKSVGDQAQKGAEQAAKGENAKADTQIDRQLLDPNAVLNHLNAMGPATVLSARTAEVLSSLDPAAVSQFETDLLATGGEFSSLFSRLSEMDRAMVVSDLFLDKMGATPVIANI